MQILLALLWAYFLVPDVDSKRLSSPPTKQNNGAVEISLPERILRLNELLKQSPLAPITLSFKQYRQLVLPAPRNFSFFVLFVNGEDVTDEKDSEYCGKCDDAIAWWNHVASIHFVQEWRKNGGYLFSEKPDPVFFGIVKIYWDKVSKVKVPVQINQPNMYYFGNTTSGRKMDSNFGRISSLNSSQFKNDEFPRQMYIFDLLEWITECSGIVIDLRTEPLKWNRTGVTFIWMIAFLAIYFVWRVFDVTLIVQAVWDLLNNINYKYLAVCFALWCVSGQLYNQMKNTGWAYYDKDHNMVFVAPGHSYQLLSESFIVMALYAGITISFVQLIQKAEDAEEQKINLDPSKLFGSFILLVSSFMGLMHVVTIKN
ncbi:magnesium transporter protein 1 [Folsomia candida]|uniref:Magnesium transporter protein 1 n=1 Tax=Folsomia candida TaxID=158441 RepID=A0A226EPL9_FOLCA|nr:magnesium transporter protein 1 [Folsomia candida]OXA58994.1 Magnesium transporter protein 1 [Folsomia candida]